MGEFIEATLVSLKVVCKRSAKPISVMLDAMNPYVSMVCLIFAFKMRGSFHFGSEWLVPMMIFIAHKYFEFKATQHEAEDIVPIAGRRFVRRLSNGDAVIDRNDIYEIVQYVGELEEYFDRTGRYENDRRRIERKRSAASNARRKRAV